MGRSKVLRRVAIFNSRPDFIEALRVALEVDGFGTACAHLADIQSGVLDLLAFIHVHKPDLIVYDLPRPYESHLELSSPPQGDRLAQRREVGAHDHRQKKALQAAVGASGVVEIIFGEPYGVTDVVAAVHKSLPAAEED